MGSYLPSSTESYLWDKLFARGNAISHFRFLNILERMPPPKLYNLFHSFSRCHRIIFPKLGNFQTCGNEFPGPPASMQLLGTVEIEVHTSGLGITVLKKNLLLLLLVVLISPLRKTYTAPNAGLDFCNKREAQRIHFFFFSLLSL